MRDEGGKATNPSRPSGSGKSGNEFRLPQKCDPTRVQLVPNNVHRLAAVDPQSDCAAETRLYLAFPVFIPQQRCTRRLFGCRGSISTKILGEIDRVLIDFQQRFARRALSIDYVVASELDVEVLQSIESPRVMTGDRRAVDE